jgi:hypothetical protein
MHAFNLWQKDKRYYETLGTLSSLDKAIHDYYYANGRYPCPARLDLSPEDNDYGKGPATCAVNAAPSTVAGGVPFKDLKIPQTFALDGWKQKITYVVTQPQTVKASFNPIGGALTLSKFKTDPVTFGCKAREGDPTKDEDKIEKVHYVLISHGDNGTGAFSSSGKPKQACTDPSNQLDARNCDYNADSLFLDEYCAVSNSKGVNEYDDIVYERASGPETIWSVSSLDNKNITSVKPRIGINTSTPATALHVVGNIRAEANPKTGEKGNLRTNNYCAGTNTARCIPPSLIGGVQSGATYNPHNNMTCTNSRQAANGFGSNKIKCSNKFTRPPAKTCPSGQYVMGFDSSWNVICTTS